MHVGVEEAVAQRVAQEGLDHRCGRAPAGRSPWLRARRGRAAACRRSIPASARRARCGPSRPPARGSRDRPWCSPPSRTARRLRAADPSRSRPSGRSVSTTSIRRSRRASADKLSALRAAKMKASRSTRKRRSTPGRSTFTATGLAALRRRRLRRGAPARSRRRRPAGRTRRKPRCSGLPSAAATTASASACGNGAILSCRLSRSRAIARADDVGPRRQELAELDVGRAEPGQRGGEPARRRRLRVGRSISRAERDRASAPAAAAARGSTSANTPSRANTKPARPRRARWETAGDHKLPARMQRHDAAGHRREARRGGSRRPRSSRRTPSAWETCGSTRPDTDRPRASPVTALADRRDDVERIKLVERVEAGHIDRGEFQAEEAPADLQHAMRFGERALDARHVADAEGDGDASKLLSGKGSSSALPSLEGDGVVEPALARRARGRPPASRH